MQEYGWHHRNDFRDMVGALGAALNARKLRLVVCACVRRLGELLDAPQIWQAIEATEDTGTGKAEAQLAPIRPLVDSIVEGVRVTLLHDRNLVPDWMIGDLNWTDYAAQRVAWNLRSQPMVWATNALATVLQEPIQNEPLCRAIDSLRLAIDPSEREQLVRERKSQCDILRDVFGNPFRSAEFSPSWRTDTAVLLAQQMYESREFSAVPILADALQDAGCDSEHILNHCRDTNQVHVCGCWVVDLVLDKQ